MTLSLPRTAFPPGSADRLDRRIRLARLSLAVERLAPALWPALGFFGLYLTLALFGVFALIPWTLQALALAATITATALSLYFGAEGVAWPRASDGARRLERDNGLKHRPISERGDVMAGGADALAQALWRAHQARGLSATALAVALPRPSLEKRDPRNLRYVLLIALLAGLVVAHGNIRERLARAFDSGAGAAASVDAWVDPPGYTGLPLISLNGRGGQAIAVPAGSVIDLRVHGAIRAPGLLAGQNQARPFAGDNGEYASNTPITHDAHVRVRVGGHVVGRWNIVAVADAPPAIAFTATPSRTLHDAVKFAFHASDDYGVAGARVILTPHGRHGAPLVVDLPLDQVSAKALSQVTYSDLTGHPYAGLMMDARLEARDAIGQVGASRTVTFRLPARVFTDPLARALIEQRQNLATADAAGRANVIASLDALTLAPELFFDGKDSAYMAIRAVYWGLKQPRPDIAHAEDLLWQTAIALEGGGLLTAAEELRRLQQLLSAALAAGAPQEVIDALLDRYNQAMQRYLQALANNPPPPSSGPPPADTKTLSQQDLQSLLNAIQQMARSGARQQASQMMAVLQNLLENLRLSQGSGQGQGAGQGGNKALNDAMKALGGLMGQQRDLLDKTMRQQNGQGDSKDGGPQGLAKSQGQLQQKLNEALKALDPKLAGKLKGAGRAMDDAQKSLGQRNLPNAGSAEGQALQELQRGAQALAEEAMKDGQGKGGGQEDPLGRNTSGIGANVKIPAATDLARARAILEELRKRAGEMGRPQQERDYIDRLLKSF